MPTLPLPPFSPLDGGVLPVSSIEDVQNEWADEIQDVDSAPIRDALEQGQFAMMLEYQRRARYAAAQSDAARATGEYEDEILEEFGCPRQSGQDDDDARSNLFAFKPSVSPEDIITVANAVLAPYTAISCFYAEGSDGWFLGAGGAVWSSHVFGHAAGEQNIYQTPRYPGRPVNLHRRPPGAMPCPDSYGRWFLLRAPDISRINSEISTVFAARTPFEFLIDGAQGFFVGSGATTTDKNASYLFSFAANTVDGIYNSLIAAVNNAIGFGIRWDLVADPQLTA